MLVMRLPRSIWRVALEASGRAGCQMCRGWLLTELVVVVVNSLLTNRAAFVNLGDLTTYDSAKHLILKHSSLKDNYFTHALSRYLLIALE